MSERLAGLIYDVGDRICALIGHRGGCAVLNRRILARYDDERDDFGIDLPNPVYPLFAWAIRNLPIEQ